MEAEIEERGQAPVAPPPAKAGKKRRKPPVRGRKGGRTAGNIVHLTEAENAQLEARARACGLSVSSYLRAAALGDAGPRARRAPTVQAEVIARAQAFQEVGADAFMAPGMGDPAEIAALCGALDIPVAAIVGLGGACSSVPEFGGLGVRRVVVGSAFARVAMAGVLAAAREVAEAGTFGFTEGLMPFGELNGLFRRLAG